MRFINVLLTYYLLNSREQLGMLYAVCGGLPGQLKGSLVCLLTWHYINIWADE